MIMPLWGCFTYLGTRSMDEVSLRYACQMVLDGQILCRALTKPKLNRSGSV